MPIVLGMASSHAPSMFCPAEQWSTIHAGLVGNVPQPARLAEETPEVLADYVQRVKSGFETLRRQVDAAKPDAVIIIGDDQTELFSNALIPAFAIFTGESAEGTTSIGWVGQKPEDNRITLKCHSALAETILEGLMDRGFDLGYVRKLTPLGKPAAGLGHAFTRIGKAMEWDQSGTPVVLLFLNAYHPPLPSAARCYELGKALAEIFASRSERIAIYGSGGLSHCPRGPRAGWVDEPLDRWVIERLRSGEGHRLRDLFTFDSDTLRSGTGEIRAWIAVAGAFHGVNATIVDYLPAYHAVTGLGFAYWRSTNSN
jgi:protocatechuate 4,5-dioxygenase beta chain